MIAAILAAAVVGIPTSPVDSLCAQAAHGNPIATADCVSDEQFNYDSIKLIWPRVPDSVRVECAPLAQVRRPFAYSRMAACLVRQIPTIRAANARPFQR